MSNSHVCHSTSVNELIRKDGIENCTRILDLEKVQQMKKTLKTQCYHKESCGINIDNFIQDKKNIKQSQCGDDAIFYIQVPCVLPTQKVVPKQVKGLFICCTIVIAVLFFKISISYIQKVQYYNEKEFDWQTITTSDYSIEFQVTERMWQNFMEKEYDENNLYSKIGQFRIFIHYKME